MTDIFEPPCFLKLSPIFVNPSYFLFWLKTQIDYSGHWSVEARIRSEDVIFHHEWRSLSGEKWNTPWVTSDKWGILPIISSYSSFNNSPDRKVKTCKQEFSQNHKKICQLWFIFFSPLFWISKSMGKRKWTIGTGIFPQLILLIRFHYPNRNEFCA